MKNGERPSLWKRINRKRREKKSTFIVSLLLRLAVLFVLIWSLVQGRFTTALFCALTLILFLIPFFIEEFFRIELPATLEIIILLFIFCSEFLGEIACFYVNFPLWDSILHTVNGFLCAAVGFALIDLMNRNNRFRSTLSPAFITVVAFCFSMTVGVLWEFFEFFTDAVFHTDMQKDFLIDMISSVALDQTNSNRPIVIDGIASALLYDKDGNLLYAVEGGFLDVGIIDTMKDLIVNFVGALVFSVIGYFYVKTRGKGKFARRFIPTLPKEIDSGPNDHSQ